MRILVTLMILFALALAAFAFATSTTAQRRQALQNSIQSQTWTH